jgi:hypothetical protein
MTPNTLGPMILGYALILGTGFAYAALLIARRRRLLRERDRLDRDR